MLKINVEKEEKDIEIQSKLIAELNG